MKPHHDYVRLWVASIETRNFNFTAYGATKNGVEFALKQGLSAHAEQYGLESNWYHEGDIVAEEVALGHAYRYGSGAPIYSP